MPRILRTLLVFVLLAAAGFAADTPLAAEWRKKAEAGDAVFQELMGGCYDDDDSSDGIPLDYAEAVKWYRKAADQGYVFAQYNLGGMYKRGEGVPKDDAEAVMWYLKAAEQGHNGAKYILSTLSEEQVARVKAARWHEARQQEARWHEARVQAAEAATEAYRALSQNSWFPGGRAP